MVEITVPDTYGYVVLTTVVGGVFLIPGYLGGAVMKARTDMNVPYPNLYATPGFHKEADAFNRVQRGHQAIFETLSAFALCNLLGGLKHPVACSVFAVCYSIGNIFYLKGYSDTSLDVKMARYKKGGGLKWVGLLGAVGACISFSGSLCGWW